VYLLVVALAKGTPVDKNPCHVERERLQGQNAPPGTFIPTCTTNGWFHHTQSHASTGYRWCAFPQSGIELPNTRVGPGNTPQCPKCLVDRAQALPAPGMVGGYAPQCNEQGNFQKMQIHGSTGYSWCVHEITGVETPGSRKGPGSNRDTTCN